MSYKNLQDARAKRAENKKAVIDQAKVNRGRKRKSDAEEERPAPEVARTSEVLARAQGSWKAPVAQMH
jgi:hypothetical protein